MTEGPAALATMICRTCQREKPEADFYMQARDGYAPRRMKVCKVCHRARTAKSTQERRRRIRETRR